MVIYILYLYIHFQEKIFISDFLWQMLQIWANLLPNRPRILLCLLR